MFSDKPRWAFKNALGDDISRFNKRDKTYWIVWCQNDVRPIINKFDDAQDARNMAMRLAEENPGKDYVVFHADSAFTVTGKTAIIFQ